MPALSPCRHALPNQVDDPVLFKPVLGPFGLELKLFAFLLRLGDGSEIRADPSRLNNLAGNALVVEPKMSRRLDERRIQNRIVYDGLGQTNSSAPELPDKQA